MIEINGIIKIKIADNGYTAIEVFFDNQSVGVGVNYSNFADAMSEFFHLRVATKLFGSFAKFPDLAHVARDPDAKPYSIQRATEAIGKAVNKDLSDGKSSVLKLPPYPNSESWVKAVLEHLEART